MFYDARERLGGVWHRQQIVQEIAVMGRPGQMFREQARRVALGEPLEAQKMVPVERSVGADRQPDAVEGQRIPFAYGRQIAVRRASRAPVVFREDLKKTAVGRSFGDLGVRGCLE